MPVKTSYTYVHHHNCLLGLCIFILASLIAYMNATLCKNFICVCIINSQVYYMSSGLSLYFIYDFCLYHGMSGLVSYLLRYLPLSVALVTCSTVLVIRYVIHIIDQRLFSCCINAIYFCPR